MSSPISGFTAIPNPQMLAFMPIQSYLMMYFAGAGWQIGKRKISAIPNDEFNKMSANDLLKGFTADLRGSIPTLNRSLEDVTPLIATLIEQYGDFVTIALEKIPQAAQNVIQSQFDKEGTFAKWLIDQFKIPEAEAFSAAHREFGTQKTSIPKSTTTTTSTRPFIGPEINPRTGETTPFVAARKSLPLPAPHIVSRPTSNLSIQSIKLEVKSLEDAIRILAQRLQQEQNRTGQQISTKRARVNAAFNQLQAAKQKLADFLKMHGSRL